MFLDFPDFAAKCLQLFKEAVPSLLELAFYGTRPRGHYSSLPSRLPHGAWGIDVQVFEARRAADIADTFHALHLAHTQGVLVLSSPPFGGNPQLIAGIAARKKVPTVSLLLDIAREGGLFADGLDIQGIYSAGGRYGAQGIAGQ